ncbi:MAG: hypothetical protein LBR95_05890 [Azoarcus sp.]|jgi:hypothetical protein|nr:hypothetical protein [Azoarcus sp.]
MKRQYALLGAASALSMLCAPLAAHPLDDASIWVYEGARPEAKTPPPAQPGQAAKPSDAPESFFMTVFPETGERRLTLDVPARRALKAKDAAPPGGGHHAWTAALGIRRETLDWNIAPLNGVPNVLSELEWETNMVELRIDGEWIAANGFTLTGEMTYASGFSGEARDSDYLRNDRQGEFSRAYAKPRSSTASRLALGLGWRIAPHSRVGLTPLLGYAYQEQDLRMRHGRQAVSVSHPELGIYPPPLGPFHGLDASYQPRWHGPWLGFRLEARGDIFDLRLGAKRQWFDYRANADWNLRDDFAHPRSYTQHGYSRGWQWELGGRWKLSPQSAITFTLEQQQQHLKNGTDRVFFSSGHSSTTRLNRVNWESWSAALGWRVDF